MFLAYCLFIKNALFLFVWQLFHIFEKRPVAILRNIILLIMLPIIVSLIHIHWLFFILDEVLFFNYRKTKCIRPIFIIGIPRSGTTFLQRTLANDTQFTSTTLADCVFTPSITQRYLAQFFRWICSPIANYSQKFTPKFFNSMQDIHTLGLNEPEEDFFMLTSIFSCFIQMTIFPNYPPVWKLAKFDKSVPNWERKIIMNFYKKMVQKHVYFYGKDKTYLAKNPSFTSWVKSLHKYFEQPIIVACIRNPDKTVPSQISSLAPIFNITKHNIHDLKFINNIHSMLFYYYKYIEKLSKPKHIQPLHVVEMNELTLHLNECIHAIYEIGGYSISKKMQKFYEQLSKENKQYTSKHTYIKQASIIHSKTVFDAIWPMSPHARLINPGQ
ncbi:sulfotransferase [Marinicellulosiphila megalodicopiae]|uniref:sulfotransferase n=1 Tax=Marinicellulosiphila megalodicopiae TaxID=2724896 RepID=UPI003BB0B6AC